MREIILKMGEMFYFLWLVRENGEELQAREMFPQWKLPTDWRISQMRDYSSRENVNKKINIKTNKIVKIKKNTWN